MSFGVATVLQPLAAGLLVEQFFMIQFNAPCSVRKSAVLPLSSTLTLVKLAGAGRVVNVQPSALPRPANAVPLIVPTSTPASTVT